MKLKHVKGLSNIYNHRVDDIYNMAQRQGWELIDHQENIGMLSFYRKNKKFGEVRINVYVSTLTVSTALDHPKKGKTQLFRRNINRIILSQIFSNPRIHSGGRGYYKRKD